MDKFRLKYLAAYPEHLQIKAQELVSANMLGSVLQKRYPFAHDVRNDNLLYEYAQDMKTRHLVSSSPLTKVVYDNKIHVINQALGLHTVASRVQGGKLKAKREIRISSIFKSCPLEFLSMIVTHELAHFRVQAHDKAFYKLCTYIEPNYHQYELDFRLFLTHLDTGGEHLWEQRKSSPLTGLDDLQCFS